MVDRSFEYKYVPIGKMQVSTREKENGKSVVDTVEIDGERFNDSPRFWTSLYSRYGFNSAFFKYFDHAEVFNRISERERSGKSGKMRVCVERTGDSQRLLAVSNPNNPIAPYDDVMDLITTQGGDSVNYSDGVVESTHIPSGNFSFQALGDDFEKRFVIQTPIDGFGQPNIYLSVLRMVCTNGLVAMSKEFKTGIGIGKGDDNVMPSIMRAMDGFNNEEGFAALRDRIEKAGKSWLSVYEYQRLCKAVTSVTYNSVDDSVPTDRSMIRGLLNKRQSNVLGADEHFSMLGSGKGDVETNHFIHILRALYELAGDPERKYGVGNLNALSTRKQRTLPVGCTVYDAINFATEVATHHLMPGDSRKIQSWVGSTVTEEYDLEGTREKFKDFSDFFVTSKIANNLTGSIA
jgi:hypothetical protein